MENFHYLIAICSVLIMIGRPFINGSTEKKGIIISIVGVLLLAVSVCITIIFKIEVTAINFIFACLFPASISFIGMGMSSHPTVIQMGLTSFIALWTGYGLIIINCYILN